MFAKGSLVGPRRTKRRLKAAASIVVAVAAGTFLACQRGVEVIRRTTDANARNSPSSSTEPTAPEPVAVASSSSVADAGSPDALATVPSAPAAIVAVHPVKGQPTVDIKEHRKGMPVPDNLLE